MDSTSGRRVTTDASPIIFVRERVHFWAGLFEEWHGEGGEIIESCTVLTTEASADLEGIHHRMPVILDRIEFDAWLDPTTDLIGLQAMMLPATKGTLEARSVTRRVNNARFDDPQCLLPDSEPEPKSDPTAASASSADQGDLFGRATEGAE